MFSTPFDIRVTKGEKNELPSLTVQGDAYTVKQLLEKHVQGIMPPVGLDPLYDHEEPSFEDDTTLRNPDLDLTDIDKIKDKIEDVQRRTKSAPDRTSVASSGASRRRSAAETATSGAVSIEETNVGKDANTKKDD